MSNPYSAPNAVMSDAALGDERYEPKVFAVNGRIGRLRYFAYGMAYGLLMYLVLGIAVAILGAGILVGGGNSAGMSMGAIFFIGLIGLGMLAAGVVLMRRRLNDLDKSGWFSVLMFIPIINFFMGLYLMFFPGSEGANRWGPKPVKNSVGVIVVGLLLPLTFIGILAAVAIPAYQNYVERAKAAQMEMQDGAYDESYDESAYDESAYDESYGNDEYSEDEYSDEEYSTEEDPQQ